MRRTSAYIDEIDLHMAELTVRETLDFSARCLGSGETPGEPMGLIYFGTSLDITLPRYQEGTHPSRDSSK